MLPQVPAAKTFTTQVDVPPFSIGSGVLEKVAASVASAPGPAVGVGQTVPAAAWQSARDGLGRPSGGGPSSALDVPPTRRGPPEARSIVVEVPSPGLEA